MLCGSSGLGRRGIQMLEAGAGMTPAFFRLNRQCILPGCTECKDSQPALLARGRIALHISEFCKHPGRTQNAAFAGALILWATATRKRFCSTCSTKTATNPKTLAPSSLIQQAIQDTEVCYSCLAPCIPAGCFLPKFPPAHRSEPRETSTLGLPEEAAIWGTAQWHARAPEKLPIRVLFTCLIGKTPRRLVLMAFFFFKFVRGLHCLLELLL